MALGIAQQSLLEQKRELELIYEAAPVGLSLIDRDKCLNGGCDDYLSKPIDHAKLVNLVAKYTTQFEADELMRRRRDRLERLRDHIYQQ